MCRRRRLASRGQGPDRQTAQSIFLFDPRGDPPDEFTIVIGGDPDADGVIHCFSFCVSPGPDEGSGGVAVPYLTFPSIAQGWVRDPLLMTCGRICRRTGVPRYGP